MKRLLSLLIACALAASAPALAKTFVHDDAAMFGAQTVSQLDTRISNFNAQTGKEIVVQTVDSVAGGDVRTAAQNAFAQQQVNGVLIFIDKGDRKDWIVPDQAAVQAGWWSSQTSASIASAMEAQFKAGDYDGGITTAVNLALNVYRSHLGSRSTQPSYANGSTNAHQSSSQGIPHISMFWWIIIALFAFFIIRSIMRAASAPRYYGGGAPGPGGPGYGPGYGGGFGGGGFFSGLLGGLGGAFLGNELFGGRGAGTGAWDNQDPTAGAGAPGDAGGWQSDPGQAGIGGGGGGDWGGGGFGGGGGGDFGGGGGGGGGGDAGGGW